MVSGLFRFQKAGNRVSELFIRHNFPGPHRCPPPLPNIPLSRSRSSTHVSAFFNDDKQRANRLHMPPVYPQGKTLGKYNRQPEITVALPLNIVISVLSEETEIIQPFLLGCDTKSLRVVQISLTALQRLISHQAISEVSHFSQNLTDNSDDCL